MNITDSSQAYRVQALVIGRLGAIGGWKVGAPGPNGSISCAPMPAVGLFTGPHVLDSTLYTQREVESEICFRLNTSLPPRATAYDRADVVAAIGSCHPGIEVLQSRLLERHEADPLTLLADIIQTGAYFVGKAVPDWRQIDFTVLPVTQTIEGLPAIRAVGNPAGDMMRLVTWLANEGAVWAGGLQAGQIVTCGSWTGKTAAPAESVVTALFDGMAPVELRFQMSNAGRPGGSNS